MNDYIALSTLNDFIFCPYSIYLHSVYMEAEGDVYKATPQTRGTLAHKGVDEKTGSARKADIMALPVCSAEANFLLRHRQHLMSADDISVASVIVRNKIENQRAALQKTRRRDALTLDAISQCTAALDTLPDVEDYNKLMGLEGTVAKTFFAAYYQDLNWRGRHPRMKCDVLNVTLDIGYTILFNFIECFLRLYGFDLYVGVYHRLWFKRKSLVCDIVEPFRCIIDHATLLAFNRKQFSEKDFTLSKKEYFLKHEYTAQYYKVFCDALVARKQDIFKFVQQYYRCFMGCKSVQQYPSFKF